jgi:hypothetical protein
MVSQHPQLPDHGNHASVPVFALKYLLPLLVPVAAFLAGAFYFYSPKLLEWLRPGRN